MRKHFLYLLSLFFVTAISAQKKPLDHSVYDSWQSIAEKFISNDGKFVVYTVNPQEGDGSLIIQQTDGKKLLEIARGYNAKITEDNKYVVCKIKPTFQQTRTAKVQKKKPDEMPKDSLAIVEISSLKIEKIARIKSYKIPEKSAAFISYLSEKSIAESKPKAEPDSLTKITAISKMADSLLHVADSLKNKVAEVQTKGIASLQPKKENKPAAKPNDENIEEGTELTILNLENRQKNIFKLANDYVLSKTGNSIVIKTSKKNNDTLTKALVLKFDFQKNKIDTLLKGLNDAKSFAWDENGEQLAFVAERDSVAKALQKFYKLYYYKPGFDTAKLIADRNTKGLAKNWTISEFANISFSKSGKRLFLGTAPILPPKDTTLPEFERVSVDIWNYKDDDLMTAQLFNLERELKKNYLARFDFDKNEIVQLGNEKIERVAITNEGDGNTFYGLSDFGKRIERQWQGYTLTEVFAIDPNDGSTGLITKDFKGFIAASYTGKYLLVYNEKQKKYFAYNSSTKQLNAVAKDIPYSLYDEEFDMPDDPNPYGVIKWMQDDKAVLIYDRYDVWSIDPDAKEKSVCLTNGRKSKNQFRYITVDADEKFVSPTQQIVLRVYNETDKSIALAALDLKSKTFAIPVKTEKLNINFIIKAKDNSVFALTKETFNQPPDIYSFQSQSAIQLSHINPQQNNYTWGTAELFKWKAYTGKETEGVLYKPDNFDVKKKYPMIVYFYERNNNTLYNYLPPSPTPSRLNIPFFVSRGYIVFVPDIWYTTGHPGKDAYNYIVSGTRALIKQGYIDSTKLGLQGQSWGGYQTAYLITQTNLYAAAWAGAPVVNMFSAYGGIRWESGINRQFQYEHSQSRIGATPWDRRDLYIENSPLFHLPKVKTPLVIMSNDADGAVPWYQGIEFFSDMRRLGKPVWLLNYNGEAHNLVERKNRKDIQIREQQFFDWLLKGEKPAKWITDGVPATMKGRDWGLGTN
jgi:dipeptidyl aminopeptidase/acylaminoacyl peptidase